MARITIEDCNEYVENRFELILVAAQRGKELNHGAVAQIDNLKKDKEAIVALREIAVGLLDVENLKKSIVKKTFIDDDNRAQSNINKKTFDQINEEVLAEIESLKESQEPQSEQLFKNEEDIQE